jgi:ATP-dependent RNA helicase DeaD
MLVFVKTKAATVELAERLEASGHACGALNGDVAQRDRERIVENFKRGKIDILVATDVAARGLDVERVSHVINYDIPYDTESYVHRVGRTGRAGRSGEAILFVSPREKGMLNAIEQATKQKIELLKMPSTEDINDRRVAQFKQKITDTLANEDLGIFPRVIEQYVQEHDASPVDVAAALARMLQGEEPFLLPPPPHKREAVEEGGRERPAKREKRSDAELGDRELFRIEVGARHGVAPGAIVGAIANEAGLAGRYIGQIDIYEDFSTVALPPMPNDIFKLLQKVRVAGQKLNISRVNADELPAPPRKPRPHVVNKKSPGPKKGGPGPRKGRDKG